MVQTDELSCLPHSPPHKSPCQVSRSIQLERAWADAAMYALLHRVRFQSGCLCTPGLQLLASASLPSFSSTRAPRSPSAWRYHSASTLRADPLLSKTSDPACPVIRARRTGSQKPAGLPLDASNAACQEDW